MEIEIEETIAKAQHGTEPRSRVWMMRGRHGKRPQKVLPVEKRLLAEEQMVATRTAGELPLHCCNVAVTGATEAVKKKDVAKQTNGPAPRPFPSRVLIVDPEGSKATQALQEDMERRGAAVQLVMGRVTRRNRGSVLVSRANLLAMQRATSPASSPN